MLTQSQLHICNVRHSVIFAIAIIIDPNHPENSELGEWIIFAEDLIKLMTPHNSQSALALQLLDVIRRRSQFVRCITAPPNEVPQTCTWQTPQPVMETLERMDRAISMLSQPVPSMTDRLGHALATDPMWESLRATVYSTRFPSMNSLSKKMEPDELEHFLDSVPDIQERATPNI
jgi:hypothetical protein